MHWLLIAHAVVVALVLLVVVAGPFVPRKHTVTRHVVVQKAPEDVWRVLTDFAAYPAWRSGMKKIERRPDRDGKPVWAEDSKFGKIPYVVDASGAPHRLVTVIADASLPFAGRWTYVLSREKHGTRVAITEDGEIKNALFRVLAHYVFGYTRTIDTVLKDLGKRLGEDVLPA
ncbi:MAG: SRPBCC family protein [Planctomycetes bacterium]|nr:SRPBCC family protein [Planctomycetota bacterium]